MSDSGFGAYKLQARVHGSAQFRRMLTPLTGQTERLNSGICLKSDETVYLLPNRSLKR